MAQFMETMGLFLAIIIGMATLHVIAVEDMAANQSYSEQVK